MTATRPTYQPRPVAHLTGMTTTAVRPSVTAPVDTTRERAEGVSAVRGILVGVVGGAAAWAVIIGGVVRFFA